VHGVRLGFIAWRREEEVGHARDFRTVQLWFERVQVRASLLWIYHRRDVYLYSRLDVSA